jgi:hypothetical protein
MWLPRTDAVTAQPIDFGYRLRVFHVQYRNSFAPVLDVRMMASPSGTSIQTRTRIDPSVKAFMTVWFALLSLIGGTFTIVVLVQLLRGQLDPGGDQTPGMIILVALATLGIGMVTIGRRVGARDGGVLLAFVTQLLEVREADAAVSTVDA